MDVIEMISELEDKIDKSFEIPFIKKAFIQKEEIMELINDISLQLPEEIRVAKSITADRKRIISDAQRQADIIVKGAEQKIVALIDEHEITKRATENANEIIVKAQKNSREIRLGTLQFADDVLSRIEGEILEINDTMKKNMAGFSETLKNCRSELRK